MTCPGPGRSDQRPPRHARVTLAEPGRGQGGDRVTPANGRAAAGHVTCIRQSESVTRDTWSWPRVEENRRRECFSPGLSLPPALATVAMLRYIY